MNAQTKVSAKGQVVIPKDVRDRYHFASGNILEVIERPDGVLLRRRQPKTQESFDEITARIRARVKYDGPPVTIAEMNETIDEMWAKSGENSDR